MSFYTPAGYAPSPFYLLKQAKKVDDMGKITIIYETPEQAMQEKNRKFFATIKTFQGTKNQIDSQVIWEDTAELSTRFHPDIKHGCRVYDPVNRKTYEVVNEPENIGGQNLFTVFTVRRVITDA